MSGTLLYDGDCGFCTKFATLVAKRFRDPASRHVPWQSVESLATFGLTEEIMRREAAWVADDGQVALGHRAIGRSLEACRGLARIAGRIVMFPLLALPASLVYRVVARNRHRISRRFGRACVVRAMDEPLKRDDA